MRNKIPLILLTLCLAATIPTGLNAKQIVQLPEGAISQIGLEPVHSIKISPDGGRIAVLTNLGIFTFNAITFEPIGYIKISYSDPTIFTFHSDSKHIITNDFTGNITLWDTDTGERKQTLFEAMNVKRMEFNTTGDTLATTYRDGNTGIWNVETGKERLTLKSEIPSDAILCLAFAPNSFLLAISDKIKAISLYDSVTGELKHTLKGHRSLVQSAVFSPDGSRLASASGDRTIFLWDTETGQIIKEFTDEKQKVWQLAFNVDGTILAATNRIDSINLWDVNTGEHIRTLGVNSESIGEIAFSLDFRSLISCSSDGVMRKWNISTGEVTQSEYYDFNYYNDFSVRPDGSTIVALCNDFTALFFDLTSDTLEIPIKGDVVGGSKFIRMSPDGKTIASVQDNKTIVLYDSIDEQSLSIDTQQMAEINAIEFSSEGKTIGVGCEDNTVQLYDVGTGELKHNLKGHEDEVFSITFSSDGNIVASGGEDSTLRFWDIQTGEMKRVIQTRAKIITELDISPDGKFIAIGAHSKNVNVYYVETGMRQPFFRRLDSDGVHVAYSPDGRSLAIGDIAGGITIIDTLSKKHVHKFKSNVSGVRKLAFAMNGKVLVSRSGNVLHLWDTSEF